MQIVKGSLYVMIELLKTRSLWRDWSSTGLLLFYNLQKF